MTLMLILGGIAVLYAGWLLFRLAALALPVGIGIGTAMLLAHFDYGPLAVLALASLASLTTLLGGRYVLASTRPATLRVLVILAFAVPAGCAGYFAVDALVPPSLAEGRWYTFASVLAALITACAAWRSLHSEPLPPRCD